MNIRYGYDIALELGQPATILAMADVHSDFRGHIIRESELEVSPAIAAERFVDDNGNIVRRLVAPAGQVSLRLQGVFRADGREDEVDNAAEAVGVSDLPADALPFLLASRTARPICSPISPGRTSAPSAAAGRGCRRSATSFISASDLAIRRRVRRGPQARPLAGGRRRMPRLHPSGGRFLPLP